jgi:hypothetical protein
MFLPGLAAFLPLVLRFELFLVFFEFLAILAVYKNFVFLV